MRIQLQKQRDFGNKVSATIDFVRQEFKPFYKSIFFIVGPLIFISAVVSSYFSLDVMQFSLGEPDIDNLLDLYSGMAVPYLLGAIVQIGNVTIILSYMKLYKEGETDITVDKVFQEVKKHILVIIGASIVYSIVVSLGLIFFIIPGVILSIYLLLMNPIIINEGTSIGEAFSRCFTLMKGKWWSTFGLLLIVGIIASIIASIFSIPNMVISMIWSINSLDHFEGGSMPDISSTEQTIFVAVTTVTTLLSYFAYALPNVALAFQYYNLVERSEASGLMSEISQMGSQTTDEKEDY